MRGLARIEPGRDARIVGDVDADEPSADLRGDGLAGRRVQSKIVTRAPAAASICAVPSQDPTRPLSRSPLHP